MAWVCLEGRQGRRAMAGRSFRAETGLPSNPPFALELWADFFQIRINRKNPHSIRCLRSGSFADFLPFCLCSFAGKEMRVLGLVFSFCHTRNENEEEGKNIHIFKCNPAFSPNPPITSSGKRNQERQPWRPPEFSGGLSRSLFRIVILKAADRRKIINYRRQEAWILYMKLRRLRGRRANRLLHATKSTIFR